MQIDTSIFKAYDIRGTYPSQLNEETIYKIGRAFVEFLKVKEVALGYDMRLSTPSLKPHLIAGINDAGAKVIDLGMIGTEVMYFVVGKMGFESGIMLTASHNPPQYNGMKFVSKGSAPISGETGIYEIRDMVVNNTYERKNVPTVIEEFDPFPEYVSAINKLVDISKLKAKKIVVDAGNGIGGLLVQKVFANSKLEIIPMYFDLDGSFPNHQADPIKEENTADLRKRVIEEKADLGIALDGDGDRCFFIDENGKYSLGYFVTAILAKKMLEKYPNAKIVHETRLLWALEDEIKKAGGTPVSSKAGHSYLKAKMREVDAVFSGEVSSHFFYKDMYFADSSMLTIALILELLTKKNASLSELFAPFRSKYFISGEINFEVENADEALAKVKKYFEDLGFVADELDGVSFADDRNWRVNLRKSNTEPLVRLNIEANSQNLVDEKVKELTTLIL